jgi:ABC-type glutathione transport system ATPase component
MAQNSERSQRNLLEANELRKSYRRGGGVFSSRAGGLRFAAVDGLSLREADGETFAVVGESGCGKTTLARLLLRLIEPDSGEIRFVGQELLSLDAAQLRAARRQMQMVFQDPFASLDPRMRVGEIVAEPLAPPRGAPFKNEKLGAHRGDARTRRTEQRFIAALSARIFRRPASAHRNCSRADPAAQAARCG